MKPYFKEKDLDRLQSGLVEILSSGRLTLGKYTEQFEEMFARYVGVKHAVAANSGTATLEMIYRAIDVAGKEVITPTNTHIATSNAVLYAGGKPVLADIDPDSLCINVEDAFSKINADTRALVVVHIAGLVHPRMEEIRERCAAANIALIEDSAHAHGATTGQGSKAGSLSRAASFSFYPAKVITSIEGGMVTTNDDRIAESCRCLRNHGSDSRGLQIALGNNWRMSELHSLVGIVQLGRIEEIIEKKNRIARAYESALSDNTSIAFIKTPNGARHSYYKFPVVISPKVNANSVQTRLKTEFGIETGTIYYPPCHLQPIYKRLFGYKEGMLPISEDVLKRTITLPIYADMDSDQVKYVASCLQTAVKSSFE